MKYLILLFAFISFSGFSQDVIYKKDGTRIEAKVIEITSTTVKYKLWGQEDGPLRNVSIKAIKEIVYNDGTWDNFENVEVEEEPERDESDDNNRRPPGPPRPSINRDKNPVGTTGVSIDFLPGFGLTNYTNVESVYAYDQYGYYNYVGEEEVARSDTYFKFGFRVGTKWMIGGSGNFRTGIQAHWIEIGLFLNGVESFIGAPKMITPLNVGSTNVLKFDENKALEMNLTTGYNMDIRPDMGEFGHGINLNPAVLFRYKILGIGVDYRHVFGIKNSGFKGNWDLVSVNIKLKF